MKSTARQIAGQIASAVFATLSVVWPRRYGLQTPVARRSFLKSIPETGTKLEIGPFANPKLKGVDVSYFDIMDRESLVERAQSLGLDPSHCPEIDYVSPTADLTQIDRAFDVIFSSHCIEHQPDFVRHLAQVESLLAPGGSYYLIVPDKRYCFDHYIGESKLPDIYAAMSEKRRVHTETSILNHRLFTTHNSALRHWIGFHGPRPSIPTYADRMESALAECAKAKAGEYIDVHAWFFTPVGFRNAITALRQLKLVTLEITKIYDTLFGQFEFFVVLRKQDRT